MKFSTINSILRSGTHVVSFFLGGSAFKGAVDQEIWKTEEEVRVVLNVPIFSFQMSEFLDP